MKRTILVSGANRGIGKAIVEGLAGERDNTVLLGCRDVDQGGEIARKIGNNVQAVALDLSSRELLAEHIAIIDDTHAVDVLINNAGVLHEGSFLSISDELLDQTLRVNVMAAYELMRAFVPGMIERGYGRVVNLSSGWGSFSDGLTGPFSYSFSKASLNALTVTLARDLPRDVKVNSMCPGWVRTRMGGMMASRSPKKGAETAIWLANLPKDGPSGKFFRDKREIEW